ncbi:MAG: M3 family peptidase [Castellaniella sp.]|uniref:M3 family metallopeptidase n=1 Tax=Castellaniella sp. TaxID=1955812 RepID=UPI00120720C1|nr:M3 family metallopeptidase [Castellaniella sp.]TAN30690.1 MAG: M3 family peptidase [Castellaniella sp.]
MTSPSTAGNPLLVPAEAFVDYASIRPEHIETAIRELITATRSTVEEAAACTEPPTWENLVEGIENPSEQLHRAWAIAGHLNGVVNTPELRAAYNDCLPLMSEFSTWVGLHRGLYERYRALAAGPLYAELSATRRHIVHLALRDFRLSGVELEGAARETYARNADLQAQVSQKYSENVMDATDGWTLLLTDETRLRGLPANVVMAARQAAQAAGEDGWKLSLHMPCYLPVMQHAHDRELRQTLYRAYGTRASDQGDPAFDNSEPIESLLALRAEEASLLGYADFAALRLETRMAHDAPQVLDFLRELAARARPSAQRDLEELRAFATARLDLGTLEPWDVAYASERLREERYAYSDEELRPYFTESHVLKGLFDVIHTLFGVHLEGCGATAWHPDARIYRVLDDRGQELGRLGMDLYARPGKQGGAWVDSERSRRRHGNELHIPLAWLTCNFAAPQNGQESLLSHDEVITLFHESGHAMHTLLSRVDDPGAAAFAAVEWDAIEMPSQFMENFCWEWGVLKSLTHHVETGEALPRALYDKMIAARNFQSGLQTLRQVEFALFDMLIHTQSKGLSISAVLDTLDQVRREVALLVPPAWHRFPHAFSHLFAGGYGAGYYSYKWAEVLSSDAFAAFEEHARPMADGTRDVFDPDTCRRYLDEIIAVGGSRPAADSFQAFRGRAPTIDALLRHSGLVEV